jgi:hypothetical protein
VIVVRHEDEANAWPEIERRSNDGTLGVKIGNTVVDFDLKNGGVSGRMVRSDGNFLWFDYSLPSTLT